MVSLCKLGVFSLFGRVASWSYAPSNVAEWQLEPSSGPCAGPDQSPIDILTTSTTPSDATYVSQGAPALPNTAIKNELLENQHTWEVEFDKDHNATDPYGVVWGGKIYALRQFHYHSPSEHTVNGQHYDMEAHHVHYCVGADCLTPDNPDDEILVVAVFLKVTEENQADPYIGSFWNDFLNFTEGEEKLVQNLGNPYTDFIPSPDDSSFWQYTGSTTTPPCVANVTWILMQKEVQISQQQLTTYRTRVSTLSQLQGSAAAAAPLGVNAAWNVQLGMNNRPTQILGTRVVSFHEVSSAWSWLPWALGIGAALCAVALLVGLCVYFANQSGGKKTKSGQKRAVKKPTRSVEPTQEEQVPLSSSYATTNVPQLSAPNLAMVPQPLIQTVPMAYTTPVASVAPGMIGPPVAQYAPQPLLIQP